MCPRAKSSTEPPPPTHTVSTRHGHPLLPHETLPRTSERARAPPPRHVNERKRRHSILPVDGASSPRVALGAPAPLIAHPCSPSRLTRRSALRRPACTGRLRMQSMRHACCASGRWILSMPCGSWPTCAYRHAQRSVRRCTILAPSTNGRATTLHSSWCCSICCLWRVSRGHSPSLGARRCRCSGSSRTWRASTFCCSVACLRPSAGGWPTPTCMRTRSSRSTETLSMPG